MSNNPETDSQCCPLCGAPPRFQPPPEPDNTSSVEYGEFAKVAANVLRSIDSTKHDRKESEDMVDEVKAIQAWPDLSPERLMRDPNTFEPVLVRLREHQESIEDDERNQEEMLVEAMWPWLMIWSKRQDGPDKDKEWDNLFDYVKTAPLEESRQMEERSAMAAPDEEQSEEKDCDSDTSAVTADEEQTMDTADATHPTDTAEDEETEERLPQKVQLPKELSDQLFALVDRIVAKSRRLSMLSVPTP
ncbi:hypothetical protein LQW54_012075 [Pestalotiopsis sp. IQ-011]